MKGKDMRKYATHCLILACICLFFSVTSAHATGRAGQCGPADGASFNAEPTDAAAMCTKGKAVPATVTGSGWEWTCEGSGTEADVTCSATNCSSGPSGEDGACRSYSGTHSSQPATNTSNGCDAGVFAERSDSTSNWRWYCNGTGGGADASCSANKPSPCRSYGSSYASQPATSSANGCTSGAYSDASDTSTEWRWTCGGTSCDADKQICRTYSGNHTSQPATNTASGCYIGSYSDTSDTSTKWQWRCGSTTCDARKETNLCNFGNTNVEMPIGPSSNDCKAGATFVNVADTATQWKWNCVTSYTTDNCASKRMQASSDCVAYTTPRSSNPGTSRATGCKSSSSTWSQGPYSSSGSSGKDTWGWQCTTSGGTLHRCGAAKSSSGYY